MLYRNSRLRSLGWCGCVGLGVAFACISQAHAQTHPSNATPQGVASLAPLLEKVIPAVVSIGIVGVHQTPVVIKPAAAGGEDPMVSKPKLQPFRSGGSGVIIDAAKGIILTNVHVVADAIEVQVGLSDGRAFPAKILGQDPGTDVAVIKIDAPGLHALPLGNSDALKVGDYIVAVGNPFGLERSASLGIVSAKMRNSIDHAAFESYIQIDAAINPGNSGGALVDLDGRLVGINTATGASRSQGISFTIPINMAASIGGELAAKGKFLRGDLGIIPGKLTSQRASDRGLDVMRGAYIAEVVPNTNASKSGISVGDIIVGVDGTPISGTMDLVTRIISTPIGKTMRLEVLTKSGRRDFVLPISESKVKPTPVDAPQSAPSLKGLQLGLLLPGAEGFGATRGVRVLKVGDGPLRRLGLKPNDIINQVNDSQVDTPQQLITAVEHSTGQYKLLVTRRSRKGIVYVDAQPKK